MAKPTRIGLAADAGAAGSAALPAMAAPASSNWRRLTCRERSVMILILWLGAKGHIVPGRQFVDARSMTGAEQARFGNASAPSWEVSAIAQDCSGFT